MLQRKTPMARSKVPLARSQLKAQSESRSDGGRKANAQAKRDTRNTRLQGETTFRREVLERDGHLCRCCGRFGTEAHHAAERSTHPGHKFDDRVGLTLCWGCHQWVHDGAEGRVDQAKDRGLLVPMAVQNLDDIVAAIGPFGACRCHGA